MKHTIIDLKLFTESVRKDGRRHDYKIEWMEVFDDYLHYKRRYINHPFHESVEYFLFPKENIGIYKLKQYDNIGHNISNVYKYYVDMVSVEKKQNCWIIKDLYIDFIIKLDNRYYVVDIDEFNQAVQRKELNNEDVINAMNGLDCVLKGYYKSFNMEAYINSLVSKYMDGSAVFDANNAV